MRINALYKTQLICTVETRGKEQEEDLKRRLLEVYEADDITWLEFEIESDEAIAEKGVVSNVESQP